VRDGARRLGAAYQKVNFLRDLSVDSGELGRSYFPGITRDSLTDQVLANLLSDAREDISAARASLPALSRRPAIAVRTTIDIYERLVKRMSTMPAHRLLETRVRVPDAVKLAYALRNCLAPTSWLTR
jgi:phytoene/squalene synthetase